MLLACSLLLATSALAADLNLTGDVGIDSRNVYRGQKLSDTPSLNGRLRVENLLIDGFFVEGAFSTVNTIPVKNTRARSEWSIGWGGQWNDFSAQVSVARVYRSSLDYRSLRDFNIYNSFNYNELRVDLGYQLTDNTRVYTTIGQGFSNPDFDRGFDPRYYFGGQHTYAAFGVETEYNALTMGTLVSGQRYDNMSETRFNNAEVYATYNIWRDFEVEGRYSIGGKDVFNRDIPNIGYVGIRYNF